MSLFLFSYINLGDSMNNVLFAFICSTLAGLSTLLGGIIIFFNKKENQKMIAAALAFAAGVMITVSITDLIPESFHLLSEYFYVFPTFIILAIFVVIGIIFSMLIDYYLPEQQEGKLYRIGIVSMLAIIAHNIPEGIATFLSTTSNPSVILPNAAYSPSKCGAASCIIKNCDDAESGIIVRAIDNTPRVCNKSFFTPLYFIRDCSQFIIC